RHYERALAAAGQTDLIGYEERILNEMAVVYLKTGNMKKAVAFATKSLKVATNNNSTPQLPITYTTLGKIANHQKAYKQAEGYLTTAVEIAKTTGARDDEKNAWLALSNAYEGMNQTAKAFTAYQQFISLRDSLYNADKEKELTRLDMQG